MMSFTPVSAAIGGVLIGLAAVLMMASAGRVAGVSGFVSRLLPPYQDEQFGPRLAFVVGLVTAPLLYGLFSGQVIDVRVTSSLPLLVVGGFLVGIGTVLAGGCTSGHGVCGLARLSIRSVVATAVFMAMAVVTVFVVRHGGG